MSGRLPKWTPRRLGTLKAAWLDGIEAAHIAARMGQGFSTEEIARKARDLGLPRRQRAGKWKIAHKYEGAAKVTLAPVPLPRS